MNNPDLIDADGDRWVWTDEDPATGHSGYVDVPYPREKIERLFGPVTVELFEIGDIITGDKTEGLPVGSVVVNDVDWQNGYTEPLVRTRSGWTFHAGHFVDKGNLSSFWNYRVILVGACR